MSADEKKNSLEWLLDVLRHPAVSEKSFSNDQSLGAGPYTDWVVIAEADGRTLSGRDIGYDSWINSSLMTYALFHNRATGQYVTTMRDHLTKSQERAAIVDHKIPTGNTEAEIIADAKAIWKEHHSFLTKFLPVQNRKTIEALHEAETVKSLFNVTGAPHPHANLFENYYGFRHAYDGEDDFLRALNDIYGPEGNMLYCFSFRPDTNDDEALAHSLAALNQYLPTAQSFVGLYESMEPESRGRFESAFYEFMETTIPEITAALQKITSPLIASASATAMAFSLAHIKVAVEDGSGALAFDDRVNAEWGHLTSRLSGVNKVPPVQPGSVRWQQEAEQDVTASSPVPAAIFRDHTAFRSVYDGREGFLRTLNDVFGPQGNIVYCHENGVRHSDWGGYRSGADIAAAYGTGQAELIQLYEKMDSSAQIQFQEAFHEFMETAAPAFAQSLKPKNDDDKYNIAVMIGGELAFLSIALEHGPGALEHKEFLDLWAERQMRFTELLYGETPRPPRIQPHVLQW